MAKYLTKFGLAAIREKIAFLEQRRQGALQAAGEAAQNDSNAYHDNFEYEEGMRQQELFSQQLRSLCKLLDGAVLAPQPADNDRVAIGHYVLVRRPGDAEAEAYVLCGDGEGAVLENACSASSPMGRTLLGMKKGESRTVALPDRAFTVEVLEIRVATQHDVRMAGVESDGRYE
ncbi:MAG: GreA/GreB family elongation factor [Thermoguttaceae bacterium]|jgi:transcription elongation factor GreA